MNKTKPAMGRRFGAARENTTRMRTGTLPRTLLFLLTLAVLPTPPASPQDASTPPTTASRTASMKVEGDLLKVEGRYYVIKDDHGKELYLLVSPDTALAGSFRPGDRIEVWTSPIEHAIAIRASTPVRDSPAVETATHTLRGKLIAIEGTYYVMIGADGKEIRLLVNHDTELAGEFEPGDQIEVFTAPIEHAVSIKSAK